MITFILVACLTVRVTLFPHFQIMTNSGQHSNVVLGASQFFEQVRVLILNHCNPLNIGKNLICDIIIFIILS